MTRIAVVADTHADESRRWDEHCRVMTWLASDIADRGCDLVLHTGDVWERRSTSVERAFVADWVRAIADRAPLAVVAGNHDEPGAVAYLERLRTRNRVVALETPAMHVLAGVGVAMLPWPRKGNMLAALGRHVGAEESGVIAVECLRHVLTGLGAELAEHDGPRVLACHAMIDGAHTDHDQPIVGADMAVSLADLALARADFVACGHVHAQNDWDFGGTPVVYPGAPRSCNFGEPGPKGYVIVEFDGRRRVGWERVPTPATPMHLFEGAWRDGQAQITSKAYPHADIIKGSETRVRYRVTVDERDPARRAFGELRERMLADGAIVVKLEEEVEATTRARAPEVAEARTLADQLRAFWKAKNIPMTPEREARVLGRLATLETEIG